MNDKGNVFIWHLVGLMFLQRCLLLFVSTIFSLFPFFLQTGYRLERSYAGPDLGEGKVGTRPKASTVMSREPLVKAALTYLM